MIHIPGVSPFFMWLGFLVLIAIFLIIDLGVFNKKQHEVSVKEALIWTGVWFSMAMVFNFVLYLSAGLEPALNFLGGYLLEKSLSIDNIFVIFLVFMSFKIEGKYQHRILFWGIIGAIVLRGLLIILGAALVQKFDWIFYLFGAFLLFTAFKMIFHKDEDFDPHESWIVKIIHRFVPVTKDHRNGKLIIWEKGKLVVTIMFVALMVVEFTDVVFAFDSIPAIFGITTDPFIVFTSNIFAILGLRSLYFVIAKVHDLFHFLSYGLALILAFIGVKMLFKDFLHINIFISLGVVFSVLLISIVASLFIKPFKKKLNKRKN